MVFKHSEFGNFTGGLSTYNKSSKPQKIITNFAKKQNNMILIAVLFPWLSFMLRGKILIGILCLILQLTAIGWLPAAIWAVASLLDERNKKSC